MLRICVVAASCAEGKQFIQSKFGDQIVSMNKMEMKWLLKNDDVIYLAFGEDADRWKTMVFDACIKTPFYESLFDVVQRRCRCN